MKEPVYGEVRGGRVIIEVTLTSAQGASEEIEAAVDTGFAGSFLFPASIANRLGLRQSGFESVLLADGTLSALPLVRVIVRWGGEDRLLSAHVADTSPLLGMELLAGTVGTFEFYEGGSVEIAPVE